MYVVNSFGAGGAERHLLVLAKSMVQSGHSVMAVALSGRTAGGARDLTEEFKSAGATIVALDDAASEVRHVRGQWLKLISLIWSWRPNIVHSHLARSDFAVSIARAALPRFLWVSTLHDAYVKGVYPGHWIFPWLGWNWRRADRVVAVSGHVRDWAVRQLGIHETRISVIYHGIGGRPADRVRISDRQPQQPCVIGCLARFEPRKGMATLIRAMVDVRRKFPMARLILAGSDPYGYAKDLRKLAEELSVSSVVEIQGFCNDPVTFLGKLSVFAFASVSEGFGIVLLEAMSEGLPVVASNIYPINHIVSGGYTGYLVPPEKPAAFAEAIISLLENPAAARKMGGAGRVRCAEEFSETKMIRLINDVYDALLSSRARVIQ